MGGLDYFIRQSLRVQKLLSSTRFDATTTETSQLEIYKAILRCT